MRNIKNNWRNSGGIKNHLRDSRRLKSGFTKVLGDTLQLMRHNYNTHVYLAYRQTLGFAELSRPIGNVCPAECLLPNGQKILTVVVYNSPNQRVNHRDETSWNFFTSFSCPVGFAELGEEYDKIPVILSRRRLKYKLLTRWGWTAYCIAYHTNTALKFY